MGNSKGGGAFKRYNYYGSGAAAVCLGPVDAVLAVIYDGKAIWEGEATRSSDAPADLTGGIDGKFFDSGGYMRLYWGTTGQAADGALPGHPAYRGVCYLAWKHLLFGKDKTTAPNLEVVVRRKPVVPTGVVAEVDNTVDDGQVNPVAALAELLLSPDGGRWDVGMLDGASWQAAAAYARAHAERCYCSPLMAAALDLRRAVGQLLAMIDGAPVITSEGKIGLKLLEPGVDPGGLVTLDAAHFTGAADVDGGGWRDVPTMMVVPYFDRERSFKRADEVAHNLVARLYRSEQQARTVDFPHVTRRGQAGLWAGELTRRMVQPPVTVEVAVRSEVVAGLGPGDKLRVDVDPEPAGDGLAQLATIEERRDSPHGPTRLRLICDPTTDAAVYAPAYGAGAAPQVGVQAIEHALVVPLPTGVWPEVSVGVLATRPTGLTTEFRVFFDLDSDDSAFADLGIQTGFACRMELDEALDADEVEIDLTLLDGVDGLDSYLAAGLPETEIEARDDRVVLVLATVVDGSVTSTGGVLNLEFCSVVTRAAIDADTHTYTVLRGRLGTTARAWTADAHAWIIPRDNLVAWRHPDMDGLLVTGATGYVRLLARVGGADADTAWEGEFTFPEGFRLAPLIDWTTPGTHLLLTDGSGNCSPDLEVTDAEANLVSLRVDSVKADGTGETTHANLTFGATGSRAWTAGLTFGVGVYYLTITAIDQAGRITVGTRMVQHDDSGAELNVPDYDPPGDAYVVGGLDVDLSFGPGGADRVEYVVGTPGSAAPGGSGDLYTGSSPLTVSLSGACRLWARSGDGVDWSPWAYADYR